MFAKFQSPKNTKILEDMFACSKTSQKVALRICKQFAERSFPADTYLCREGQPLPYIYIVKDGICEIFSERHPLALDKRKTPFKSVKTTGTQVALGLD